MIAILLWLLTGAAVTAALWSVSGSMFDVAPLQRTNYRGARIVTGAGVLVPVTMLLLSAVALVWEYSTPTLSSWSQWLGPALIAAIGFSLLGLLDDVAGSGQSGGFRGHLDELRKGRISSGLTKMVGGAALGVVVAAPLSRANSGLVGGLELLRDGALIALAANLANLFDRAPGRVVKVTAIAFAAAAAVSRSAALAVPAGGIGAGLGLLRADLSERCMLGDAGSNPLGALCGMAALAAVPDGRYRWALLGVLFFANVASEATSFSTLIDSVRPLRWFDRLGSRRPG
jgi:UDP-GlcNAc:undecaprenyl-phosphate/decaprenyl-phosphate GlcNAc-1-phosphate transferase